MTTIGLIGAGRLGTAFGLYLARHGYQVVFYSRTQAKAEKAAELAGGKAVGSLRELAERSDSIGITTGDDQIGEVARLLAAEAAEEGMAGKVIFHMSGAKTSEILQPLAVKGGSIASIHPLQSFSDPMIGADALRTTYFSLEGSAEAVKVLGGLLSRVHNPYFMITAEQKPLYHAAAAIVSNALVGVMDYGFSLMQVAGIDKEIARCALQPLIEGSVRNVNQKGPACTLTGPIARGDVSTVQNHLQAICQHAPELLPDYLALARITLTTAVREQLTDAEKIRCLRQLIEQ